MLSGGASHGTSGATTDQIGEPTFADLLTVAQESVSALAVAQSSMVGTIEMQQAWASAVQLGRVLDGASNVWLAQILDTGGFVGISGSTPQTIGAFLNCSTQHASKRIKASQTLAPQTLPSGEKTEATYPATADAVRDGSITDAHVAIVESFFKELSDEVDPETRERAEQQLGALARNTRPAEFAVVAARLAETIDEDGPPPEDKKDKERTPFITFGKQGKDGLTPGKFLLDAEAAALARSIDAKLGKPGGKATEPEAESTDAEVDLNKTPGATPAGTNEKPPHWDLRSAGERRHDALKIILASFTASGKAGKHRGVTCVPVVTMTLAQLESASGLALTATGGTIPVRDALRMASDRHAFLLLLDENERPLYLGRTQRIATEDQRLALYATERGCSFPGCSKPGVWCQVHHIDEWAVDDGFTDIDNLTLACDEHHRLVGPGENQWATTVAGPDHAYSGRTLWHPPKAWDSSRAGRVNHFFRPEEVLCPPDE